jgi:hypothetical protein
VLSVPTTQIFVAAFGLLLLTRSFRESVLRLTVLALAMGLTVGVWAARNYVAYGQPILVNAAGGGAFWAGNNETYWEHGKAGVVPACAPGYESTLYCTQVEALNRQLLEQDLGDVGAALEEQRVSWQHGLDFVKAAPGRFVLLTLRKFADFWRATPDAVLEGDARGGAWRDIVAAATYIPLLLLGVLGIVMTAAQWRRLLPIYVFVVTFVAPYAVFLPATRYRLPIDFLLIVFAGAALSRLWLRFAPGRAIATPPQRGK